MHTVTQSHPRLALAEKKRPLLTLLLATMLTLGTVSTALAETLAGTLTEYSTYEVGSTLSDSFNFSDDWFLAAPEEQNDSLALASMQLVASAVEADADGYSATFLRDLGFDQLGFEGFGSADPDDCAYTWGIKTIQDGDESYTLVAVAIQSYAFDSETKVKGWQQNFTVNGDGEGEAEGEHYAFAKAADKVIDAVASLGGSGKVKYWVTGQSRGGALANLIAQRLPGKLGDANAGIYAYTFESPALVDADAIADNDAYGYIHNYVCSDDIVPHIPMWGMTRYGSEHQLKTDETDAGIVDELTKLGSAAADVEVPDNEEYMLNLVATLESRIPTRADYSAVRTDSFTDESGEQVTVTYSYQDALVNAMGAYFGGEFEGISTSTIMDRVDDLAGLMRNLAQAVALDEAGQSDEASPLYWQAACSLRSVLLEALATGETSLTDADFYALLRLAGPITVDTTYEPVDDNYTDFIMYLTPLFGVVDNADSLTYSHHFDTLIARLKVLAPQAALEDIDIPITEPTAGDAAEQAPTEVIAYIDSLEHSWLTAEASWRAADQTLEDGSIYYLDVTLRVVGYSVPDDFALTINGQDPIDAPTIALEKGVNVVRATWQYELGELEDVTITFDTDGVAKAPEDLVVAKGTALTYEDAPQPDNGVDDDGVTLKFDGWYDADGAAWTDLVARDNMTVYASWARIVDDVRFTFTIPALGEDFTAPVISEDAPYRLLSYEYMNKGYHFVSAPDTEGTYYVNCCVELKDPDTTAFALDKDEDDWAYYTGTAYANGDSNTEPTYDSDEPNTLLVTYAFEVTASPAPTYRVVSGDNQTWTQGSNESITVTVKRSEHDDETFGRFTGITVDGASVDASQYDVAQGSAIITVKPAYLKTLKTGKHTLTAQFDDGSADASFTVKASEGNTTPDEEKKDDKSSDTSNKNKKSNKGSSSSGKTSKSTTSKSSSKLAKTGDENPIALLFALLGSGTVALAGGVLAKKRSV